MVRSPDRHLKIVRALPLIFRVIRLAHGEILGFTTLFFPLVISGRVFQNPPALERDVGTKVFLCGIPLNSVACAESLCYEFVKGLIALIKQRKPEPQPNVFRVP
jgi:hypothetical protein